MRHAFPIVLLAAFCGNATAQFTYADFNLIGVNNNSLSSYNLGPADRGYDAYTVAFDWQAVTGNPWSQEARFALANRSDPNAPDLVVYKFIDRPGNGAAPNAAANSDPRRLEWNARMNNAYPGGDLWLLAFQAFPNSQANWTNISVTLSDFVPPPPPPGTINSGITLLEGVAIDINTFAANFDTEIGLYDSDGMLLAHNDEASFDIFGPSQILVPEGLGIGTYFVALTGYNAIFTDGFGVDVDTPQGSEGGDFGLSINGYALNGTHPQDSVTWFSFQVVPTPSVMAMFAFAGLMASRRR